MAKMVKNACSAGDLNSIPGLGRSHGGGHGNPLRYSCLENPMDRGAWRATFHGVTKSQTRLSNHTCTLTTAVEKVREKAIPPILMHDRRALWAQSAEADISSIGFLHRAVGAEMPTVRILLWTWDFYHHGNSIICKQFCIQNVDLAHSYSSVNEMISIYKSKTGEADGLGRGWGKLESSGVSSFCLTEKSKSVQRMGRAGASGHLRLV